MKPTYRGKIAVAAKEWESPTGHTQFVNVGLVAYLNLPSSKQWTLRRVVRSYARVICPAVSGKPAVSTATLKSAGNGIIVRCSDGSAGAVFTKANVLAYFAVVASDPTQATRTATAQYLALPRAAFRQ